MTAEELKLIFPASGRGRCDLFAKPLSDAMDEFEINTPARQAAFLAQIGHESGSLHYVRELASGMAYNNRADLGNTKHEAMEIAFQHETTPGPWWRGHGLIQITGYDNHLACGLALDLDLLNQPDALEQPVNAARSAGWFWKIHGLNELADEGKFEKITRRINGGLNGFEDRSALWEVAKAVLGVTA